jgi:hypothetical protein
MSANGAWQKRTIGKGTFNSTTGHNFGVGGGYSNKIILLQVYSKHCRICELAEKNNNIVLPKEHRRPQNFDMNVSSKSMEPSGAVQHCIDIGRSNIGVYVAALVTDDDSTTRCNVKHSFHDVIEKNFPGSKDGTRKIPSRMKRQLGWPITDGNKLAKDYGNLPIDVPEPKNLLSNPQH